MKLRTTILSFLFLLVAMHSARAGVLTVDPSFPSVDEPVTITFNAEGTPLEGYTGEIYAHTGLITSEDDIDSGGWEYVIGEWGDNDAQPQLDEIGPDQWRLEIDNIPDFYNVEAGETIYQIAMVLRSSDGGTQTDDLFIDILDEPVSVRFESPAGTLLEPYFAKEDETVSVEIVAQARDTDLDEIRLYVDGDLEAVEGDDETLTHDLTVAGTGRIELEAVAEDQDGNTTEDEMFLIVNPEVIEQARPDGLEDGITYTSDQSVTLSLYAPFVDFVYVIGDFTDWEVDPDYFMYRDTEDEDNVRWWIEIDGLEPGEEYRFQYFVEGDRRIGDLYSEKVLDPWNDVWIPDDVYPDLIPYPEDQTEGMVSVMQPGREAYDWQAEDYERPDPSELVIYELVIRDFLDDGTYANLADTLDYLKNLGVNAIELMPVSNFDGNDSWGYNPNFHLAVDKAYGPAHELKRVIDEAHKRDMAVILDVVYNHATDQSPLIGLYGNDPEDNPFIGPGHAYNVFNHLNHDHDYIKYWMDRANRHWIERFRVDGYRFDLTKGFASNVDQGNLLDGYNERRIENLTRMADEMWDVDEDAYIILEHFAAAEEEQELAEYGTDEGRSGMLLWGNLNRAYSQSAMGWVDSDDFSSDISGVWYPNQGWEQPNHIHYMESHDEQWLMYRNLAYGRSNDDYDITELPVALNRQKLVGAFFFTVPGPKMMWQFGELGYGYGPDGTDCLRPGDGTLGECPEGTPGRTDAKPVRWEYYDDSQRKSLYQVWQALLRLRHDNPTFHDTDTEVNMRTGHGQFDRRIVLEHPDMDAVIIGNFDVEPLEVDPAFPQSGTWYNFFEGTQVEVDEGERNQPITLEAGEFRIYTTEEQETPPQNILTSADDEEEVGQDVPERTSLAQNYPNPFNSQTTIRFELPASSEVTLEVFDVLGRRVTTLVDGQMDAGVHETRFDASGLSSGVYIYRLRTAETEMTRQMMLIE